MNIGIIIAIEREMKAFLDNGKNIEEIKVNNRLVYKTEMFNHTVYAIKSGYGIIDAASATQLLITKFDVELVLNFGVTGALRKELKVEDLFIVKKALNYGFDTSCIDPVKEHQYLEYKDEFIPLCDEYIDIVKEICPNIELAVVASGDKFIESKEDKEMLRNKGCNICDMEIAAIARVCNLANIKCLSIKCISDSYDGDGSDFIKNVTNSAKKAFDVIVRILKKI